MNLATTITLLAGGIGSGCNPAAGRCGRPKVLYHGTSPAVARKILKTGLGEGKYPTFTTTSPKEALSYGSGKSPGKVKVSGDNVRTVSKVALIRLKQPAIDKYGFKLRKVDRFGGPTGKRVWSTKKIIAPEDIHSIELHEYREESIVRDDYQSLGTQKSRKIGNLK